MIESLIIQNFQTHAKTRIDLDPGITCIVGTSDIGKSAVIRALRWVCTNTPGGDAFIRHGAKGCTVKLIVDGQIVTRRRTPGGDVNEYHLDDQELKAFGRDVPEPVTAKLNIGAVSWQFQHDAPFWFGETAGEVSRQLNAIVNLGVIDTCLSYVASARTKAKTRLDVAEENLMASSKKRKSLEWVNRCAQDFEAVEAAAKQATEARTAATLLHELCTEATNARSAHENAAVVAKNGEDMVSAREVAEHRRQMADYCADTVASAWKYQRDAMVDVPDTTEIDEAHRLWKDALARSTAIISACRDARKASEALCEAEKELTDALESLPKRCPTCGK